MVGAFSDGIMRAELTFSDFLFQLSECMEHHPDSKTYRNPTDLDSNDNFEQAVEFNRLGGKLRSANVLNRSVLHMFGLMTLGGACINIFGAYGVDFNGERDDDLVTIGDSASRCAFSDDYEVSKNGYLLGKSSAKWHPPMHFLRGTEGCTV